MTVPLTDEPSLEEKNSFLSALQRLALAMYHTPHLPQSDGDYPGEMAKAKGKVEPEKASEEQTLHSHLNCQSTLNYLLQGKQLPTLSTYGVGAAEQIKHILANFKNYQFFIGENMNPDGMVSLLDYREDG
ncbi:hypothetical protein P7K49_000206, partial [Saguinus oedipus]